MFFFTISQTDIFTKGLGYLNPCLAHSFFKIYPNINILRAFSGKGPQIQLNRRRCKEVPVTTFKVEGNVFYYRSL